MDSVIQPHLAEQMSARGRKGRNYIRDFRLSAGFLTVPRRRSLLTVGHDVPTHEVHTEATRSPHGVPTVRISFEYDLNKHAVRVGLDLCSLSSEFHWVARAGRGNEVLAAET